MADDRTSCHSNRMAQTRRRINWSRLMGFDADFTFWDKIVSGGIFFWSMFWLAVVIVGTVWNLIHRWPTQVWADYWLIVGIILPVMVAIVTLVWFGIGGFIDLRLLFARLCSMKRDARDDGSVGEYERPRCPRFSGPICRAETRRMRFKKYNDFIKSCHENGLAMGPV